MSRPTLADVAARAGVSVTTVSRVLNDRGYLSDRVRADVHRAIAELGYRPNEVARSLLGRGTRVVGLIVPTVADPFFGEFAAAVEANLADRGYRTLLCDSLRSVERETASLELLLAHQVAGVITSTHNDDIGLYRTAGLPIVALDRRLGPGIPDVRSDNRAGASLATHLLVDAGYRRILFVTPRDDLGSARRSGYREVVGAHGLTESLLAYGFGSSLDERRALIESALDEGGYDAAFCTDDVSALMAVEWARTRGVRVPDDFGVVGYDGSAAVRHLAPTLTTVLQPVDRLAEESVELLMRRIESPDVDVPAETVLPVTLRRGETVR
ncbi:MULTISPECIES: LacI family DNA-binding transcriptional regulator [Microbacterium]|uniref:LacI family DNA-binding transcriptional regulator n=1 Tax=Microbacterium TaxID=33882 RepID=UPI0027863731|nr:MULTISPECIES: LacI family DNA-binding transcriptional regulator [Microbacterium]MDQ1074184.1 LacI family sucrose operon transcriptional repressor [Microbacterium sp. SORGH_AS_0969]MDQ1114411.1 LacI family sucrose operon transcriptional repressor [Microbacterium testaceum]